MMRVSESNKKSLSRRADCLSIALFLALLSASRLCGGCGLQDSHDSKDNWASRNHPTTDEQVVERFVHPRLAVYALHDDEDVQEMLTNVFRERPFDRVLEILGKSSKENAAVENALGVVTFLQLLDWAETTRNNQKSSGIGVNQDDLNRYSKTYLEGVSRCFSHFEKAAKGGSKDAVINLLEMVVVFRRIQEMDLSWNGSVPLDHSADTVGVISDTKQALRQGVSKVLSQLKDQDQIQAKFLALINEGYWPALEADLRIHYSNHAEMREIEKLAQRLCEIAGADEIAKLVAATALMKAAQKFEHKPRNQILSAAKKAVDRGLWDAFWLEAEYYRMTGDTKRWSDAIEQGANVGQSACLLRHGEACFVKGDYETSSKTLSQAFDKGMVEAACYLGWMCEQGLGRPANLSMALAYYEQGHFNRIPECSERIGQLYLMGVLKAEVVPLDYQIEGLPRLPEPSPFLKQTMTNLASARIYLECAKEYYRARGDEKQAILLTVLGEKLRRHHERLAGVSTDIAYEEWDTERNDYLLERRFERMIELRNQDRREVERRNERWNGYLP